MQILRYNSVLRGGYSLPESDSTIATERNLTEPVLEHDREVRGIFKSSCNFLKSLLPARFNLTYDVPVVGVYYL